MEAKLEVRVTNRLNLPGSVLALALKVPHPGKTFGSRANQMVDQSSWHTILSISDKSTFPYLENIFHLVNLCQPLTSLRGSLAVIVRQRERFRTSEIQPTLHLHDIWNISVPVCSQACIPLWCTTVPCSLSLDSFSQKKKKKNSFLLGLQMLHWFPNLWPLLCHPLISFISHIGNPKGWICGSMIIIHKWILQGCWIQDQLKSIVFLRVCVCVCVCVC